MAVQDDSFRATVSYRPPNVTLYSVNDEIVRRLAANDPNIEGLDVDVVYMDDDDDDDARAETLGRAIGKSIYLRKLTIGGGFARYAQSLSTLQSFFMWIAHNRSIEEIKIHNFDFDFYEEDLDIIQLFAPFVELNTNLRCVEITGSINLGVKMPSLISALTHMKKNSLERVNIHGNGIGDAHTASLLNTMNVKPGLQNLLELDLSKNVIGKKGCVAISALLEKTECSLHSLNLRNNNIDDECVGILVSGFASSNTLKILHLSNMPARITQTGWQILFIFFSSPMCPLEKVNLMGMGDLADESATILGKSLAVNRIMTSLTIWCTRISRKGYQEFSRCLRSPHSNLAELDLAESLRDDAGALEIFRALVNNTTLKKLVLTNNNTVSSSGWANCFRQLTGSQSALEELYFDLCALDDEGANILVNLLSRHLRKVRLLDIRYNYPNLASGWRAFADVLHPNSTSRLETLRLGHDPDVDEVTRMNDDDVLSFVTALSNNTSLVELDISNVEAISQSSLGALVKLLCDKASIASVYNSNHTLSIFQYTCNNGPGPPRPDELDSLLKMNENKDKAQVIRKKILMSSVINEDTVGHEFGLMPMTVFPSLIEWIGRDRLGYSAMNCLVRNFLSLLDHQTGPYADDSVTLESPRKLRKVE